MFFELMIKQYSTIKINFMYEYRIKLAEKNLGKQFQQELVSWLNGNAFVSGARGLKFES